MRPYLKKILSLLTAGAMTLSALPFLSAAPDIPAAAATKDISTMTVYEIAADMGVGWNLGNTLDADGRSGLDTEISWGNPKASRELIRAVKAKGFKTIRVPVTWYKHVDKNYTIDAKWMARVKEVVDYCIDEDMYVILNIHHEEGNWLNPSNGYNALSPRLKTYWKQIATEFKDYDRHLIFEGMNEPRTKNSKDEWNGGTAAEREVINKLNQDFVDTVRAIGGKNKYRCLMIPTYAASSTTVAMNAFKMPANDHNLMVSIHCYSPYNFAMNANGTSTFSSSVKNELTNLFNRDIKNAFLSKDYPVVIGEFGATNKYNTAERIKWAQAFAELAKKNNIPIVIWDNNSIDNKDVSERYGLIERKTLKWYSVSEGMVDKLIETYDKTKTEYIPPEIPRPEPEKIKLSDCKATLSETEFVYNGQEHKPEVTVKYNSDTLKSGTDYTVKYENNIEVGTARAVITAAGDKYEGTVTVSYVIVPNDLSGYKLGDVNLDGKIDITDVTMTISAVRGVIKLGDSRFKAADVDKDGAITITDVTKIISHVRGKNLLPDEYLA